MFGIRLRGLERKKGDKKMSKTIKRKEKKGLVRTFFVVSGWTAFLLLSVFMIVSELDFGSDDQDSGLIVSADTEVSLVTMSKAQMMFTQVVTPIDPATEQIIYDQVNITISGVVPSNVNATLVRNDDRILVAKVNELNIDCLFVDPYSLSITISVHARSWNGTTDSWNPIVDEYMMERHDVINMAPHIQKEVTVTEINKQRFMVNINATLDLYIPLADVLWDLGGEYQIQFAIFIRVDGQMIRFGDYVSVETLVKNFEVSAP